MSKALSGYNQHKYMCLQACLQHHILCMVGAKHPFDTLIIKSNYMKGYFATMNNHDLYKILELPNEVITKLDEYEAERTQNIPDDIYQKLFLRDQWEQGINELQEFLKNDEDGIKVLWEQINIVSSYTYDEYVKRGIDNNIFIDTMKFCTRFLNEHFSKFGSYKYVWAWWFPRQFSLNEFRIGALEYEFVSGQNPEIAIHIPSDADMNINSTKQSLNDFYNFREKFFPDLKNVSLTCDTWMLMPDLQKLLNENSNILSFQKLFEIDNIDREAVWYMDWIYPGYQNIDENLPENTSLQRELKKYLLNGNVFGIAKGHII